MSSRKDDCPIWNSLDWKDIHFHVHKIQKRIAEATIMKDWKKVRQLQRMVFSSWDCRVLAVHRVTCRKSIRTAGVDGLFWYTDKSRFDAVEKLKNIRSYTPLPFKRLYIPKDHDKTRNRPLSVPAIYDRAVQSLFLIAVEPVVECFAGEHDYGFRLFRSSQDTVRDIVKNLNLEFSHQWVLVTDVRQCFDHLSHDWILEHAPMNKRLLRKMLKCGYSWNGVFHPTAEGVPQGGVLSPVLTSLCLQGFEYELKKHFENDVKVVRFADDFFLSGINEKIMHEALKVLQDFLEPRGIHISDNKTKIVHISQGVDYIGWHFQLKGKLLEISPSDLAKKEVLYRVQNAIYQAKNWTCKKLIKKINGIVTGWGSYHCYLCTPDKFVDIDDAIQDMLWEWAFQRHPKHSNLWIYNHYWKYNLATKRKDFNSDGEILKKFAEVKVRMKTDFDLTKNPFLDINYFRKLVKKEHEVKFFRI